MDQVSKMVAIVLSKLRIKVSTTDYVHPGKLIVKQY